MESQQTKVLRALRKAGQRGVPNYWFPEHRILRLSARLGELRAEGYNIVAERQYLPNGRATNVWNYILIEDGSKETLMQKFKRKVSK